jgi:hypothetical protein
LFSTWAYSEVTVSNTAMQNRIFLIINCILDYKNTTILSKNAYILPKNGAFHIIKKVKSKWMFVYNSDSQAFNE